MNAQRNLHVIAALMTFGIATIGANNASAIPIIDTGEASNYQGGWCLHAGQWLAGEFQVSQTTLVTGIEGFFGAAPQGASLTAAIYADDSSSGEVPGALLYSTTFQFESAGLFPAIWAGTSGLAWNLDSGNYWLAFEVGSGSVFSGYMPGNAPSALANEACNLGAGWHPYDSINMGVRIAGGERLVDPTNHVPDGGASALLLGLGLVTLGAFKQRLGR
jgi:hypothetical protein